MEIVRYQSASGSQTGVLENGMVRQAQGDMYGKLNVGPEVGPLDVVTLLSPVQPSKLIAIGLNYLDHITQDAPQFTPPENPIIFLKPPSALTGHNQPIVAPRHGFEQLDAEAELCIVIGKRCRYVKASNAYDVILGLTIGNDVSARDYQFKDGQWSRAKGFDTFAPLGPSIVTGIKAEDLKIASRVNGEAKQSSSTTYLIFDVPYLIEFVSRVMTLEPGDVIMTGTPAGPPRLQPGDVCEIEIEGLGVLRNAVVAEDASGGVTAPTEHTLSVRKARVSDAPRLRQLGVLGWETTYTDFIRPENRAAYLSGAFWLIETLSRVAVAPEDLALVAEHPQAGVVGFLTIEPYAPDPRRLELTRFYVHPDWRRSGVGSLLLDAALEQIDDLRAPALMVNVFARNAVGRAFYERAGFQLVEIVPVTVGDQVDEDAWYALPLVGDTAAHSAT